MLRNTGPFEPDCSEGKGLVGESEREKPPVGAQLKDNWPVQIFFELPLVGQIKNPLVQSLPALKDF